MPQFAAILPAAGQSTRYGGPTNKLLAGLAGEPVLARSLGAFLDRTDVAGVFLPTALPLRDNPDLAPALASRLRDPRVTLCAGGPSRAESVRAALRLVPPKIEWVAIHDAARPLVSPNLIDRVLAAAHVYGAAVPAMPIPLTIKQAHGPLPARVERTVPRQSLWAMQTPQVIRRATLLAAFNTCPLPLAEVTDDAQLIELSGDPVWLVEGEERNLKITTTTDLRLAHLLLGDEPVA